MKNVLLVFLIFIGLSSVVLAFEPITDANSIRKLAHQIEGLPQGGIVNLTFKSKIDDTFQPMLANIPNGYTKTKSWPLLIVLHGLGDGPIIVESINSMVQIGPFGRGDMWYHGEGEQDVLECIELAKQIFNIDSDRIYLTGFSMGGGGTFGLGLKYPDIWAACVPVCGMIGSVDLIPNGINLPFWVNAGSEDHVVPAKYSKRAYDSAIELGFKHWKYTEHEGMGHSFWIDWDKIEEWLLSQKKIKNPSNIIFTSEKPAKAYWAEITEKHDSARFARINIETISQTVKVKISNISDYTLYLKQAPVDLSKELTIIENDKQVFKGKLPADGIFSKKFDTREIEKVCTKKP